jgi:NhaA family Na+:H+ antiporter
MPEQGERAGRDQDAEHGLPPRTHGQRTIQAERSPTAMWQLAVERLLRKEIVAGPVLLVAAVIGLAWHNSPLAESYEMVWDTPIQVAAGEFQLELSLEAVVVEGLMAFFFLMAALEIKREVVSGVLSSRASATLPVVAAAGGIVLPAGLYLAINLIGGGNPNGWAIPIATDVAFSLAVLGLLGDRVPGQLRALLLATTVVDDVTGIIIIAVVLAEDLALAPLVTAIALLGVTYLAFRIGITNPVPYALLGVAIWTATLLSGVHATIAGVAIALTVPAHGTHQPQRTVDRISKLADELRSASEADDERRMERLYGRLEERAQATESPLDRVERLVRPWVTFIVLPLFAVAAAGVMLSSEVVGDALTSPVAFGIVAGLLVGKPVGIAGAAYLATRTGLASLPEGIDWRAMIGFGMLGAIGFTVSLFIAPLAIEEGSELVIARLAVLVASALAIPLAYAWLRTTLARG